MTVNQTRDMFDTKISQSFENSYHFPIKLNCIHKIETEKLLLLFYLWFNGKMQRNNWRNMRISHTFYYNLR